MDAIPALFDAREALDLEETWVLDIDAVFTARIANGCVEASCGAAEDADASIKTDMETFYWLVAGELDPQRPWIQAASPSTATRGFSTASCGFSTSPRVFRRARAASGLEPGQDRAECRR